MRTEASGTKRSAGEGGCSTCGNLWKEIGNSKKYICQNTLCRTKDIIFDRDLNAAKNICMKGLLNVF